MRQCLSFAAFWSLLVMAGFLGTASAVAQTAGPSGDLAQEVSKLPYKIVYETCRPEGNWELFLVNPDGSQPVNLTRTEKLDELYPHASPDGTKLSFVVDEGQEDTKSRNVYVMNLDGMDRELVVKNGRDPSWNPSGTGVIYLKGESEQYTVRDFASKGIFVYDMAARNHWQHPNPKIEHLYNICPTLDGKWYVATVHAGMDFRHAILALDAQGTKVVNLQIPGCRPDISPDGKKIAWGADDFTLCVADLDLSGEEPRVANRRDVINGAKPIKTYHIDWSPDGKYVAFSHGPIHKKLGPAPEMVGVKAEGWDICVADASTTNRWIAITHDGLSNKEPDWVPARKVP